MRLVEKMAIAPHRARWGNWLTQLVVTRRCNLECGYCNEYDKTSSPVPIETLKRAVSHLRSLGTFSLELTGGETLLHPELIDLLAYAKGIGIPRTRIITNGFLLTEAIIKELNRVELYNMQISIDGIHRNEETEKVLDNLHKRLDLLHRFATFRVTIGVVIGSTNIAEADELVAFARERGFALNLNLLHDGNGQLRIEQSALAKYRELVELIHGKHYNLDGDYRWRMVNGVNADFRCRAGSRYLYVDEFQQVVWCSQTRFDGPQKSLFEYTWDDMKNAFYTDKPCSESCTVGCARRVSRLDEWRPIGGKEHRFPSDIVGEMVIQLRNRFHR